MAFISCIYLVLCVIGAVLGANQNTYGAKINAMKCDYNSKICVNGLCKLRPVSKFETKINMGCNVTVVQPKVLTRIEVFVRSSSNNYYPGSFRFVDNYCETTRGANTIMAKTFGKALASLKDFLKPCPLKGEHFMRNFQIDSTLFPSSLLPSGDFRLDVREFNGQNETIFFVQFYLTVKNPFF